MSMCTKAKHAANPGRRRASNTSQHTCTRTRNVANRILGIPCAASGKRFAHAVLNGQLWDVKRWGLSLTWLEGRKHHGLYRAVAMTYMLVRWTVVLAFHITLTSYTHPPALPAHLLQSTKPRRINLNGFFHIRAESWVQTPVIVTGSSSADAEGSETHRRESSLQILSPKVSKCLCR